MSRMLLGFVVVTSVLAACGGGTAPSAEGTWGGTQASLELTPAGGDLMYPCGAGTIDPGWIVTNSGKFRGTGQHFFGGGPVPPEGHPPHPAEYSGQLTDSRLSLTVTLTDLDQVLGPFELVRGGPPVQELCE